MSTLEIVSGSVSSTTAAKVSEATHHQNKKLGALTKSVKWGGHAFSLKGATAAITSKPKRGKKPASSSFRIAWEGNQGTLAARVDVENSTSSTLGGWLLEGLASLFPEDSRPDLSGLGSNLIAALDTGGFPEPTDPVHLLLRLCKPDSPPPGIEQVISRFWTVPTTYITCELQDAKSELALDLSRNAWTPVNTNSLQDLQSRDGWSVGRDNFIVFGPYSKHAAPSAFLSHSPSTISESAYFTELSTEQHEHMMARVSGRKFWCIGNVNVDPFDFLSKSKGKPSTLLADESLLRSFNSAAPIPEAAETEADIARSVLEYTDENALWRLHPKQINSVQKMLMRSDLLPELRESKIVILPSNSFESDQRRVHTDSKMNLVGKDWPFSGKESGFYGAFPLPSSHPHAPLTILTELSKKEFASFGHELPWDRPPSPCLLETRCQVSRDTGFTIAYLRGISEKGPTDVVFAMRQGPDSPEIPIRRARYSVATGCITFSSRYGKSFNSVRAKFYVLERDEVVQALEASGNVAPFEVPIRAGHGKTSELFEASDLGEYFCSFDFGSGRINPDVKKLNDRVRVKKDAVLVIVAELMHAVLLGGLDMWMQEKWNQALQQQLLIANFDTAFLTVVAETCGRFNASLSMGACAVVEVLEFKAISEHRKGNVSFTITGEVLRETIVEMLRISRANVPAIDAAGSFNALDADTLDLGIMKLHSQPLRPLRYFSALLADFSSKALVKGVVSVLEGSIAADKHIKANLKLYKKAAISLAPAMAQPVDDYLDDGKLTDAEVTAFMENHGISTPLLEFRKIMRRMRPCADRGTFSGTREEQLKKVAVLSMFLAAFFVMSGKKDLEAFAKQHLDHSHPFNVIKLLLTDTVLFSLSGPFNVTDLPDVTNRKKSGLMLTKSLIEHIASDFEALSDDEQKALASLPAFTEGLKLVTDAVAYASDAEYEYLIDKAFRPILEMELKDLQATVQEAFPDEIKEWEEKEEEDIFTPPPAKKRRSGSARRDSEELGSDSDLDVEADEDEYEYVSDEGW